MPFAVSAAAASPYMKQLARSWQRSTYLDMKLKISKRLCSFASVIDWKQMLAKAASAQMLASLPICSHEWTKERKGHMAHTKARAQLYQAQKQDGTAGDSSRLAPHFLSHVCKEQMQPNPVAMLRSQVPESNWYAANLIQAHHVYRGSEVEQDHRTHKEGFQANSV